MKDLALQLREEPRQLGTAARAWLKQLASSSLRNELAVETKLAIAYENPPGWANFWSLSQALHDGKSFASKEVPKEERAILALECMDLLRLYTKSKQLSISVKEFVQIAKLLELQKRFAATLSDLASDPQFQRYYEALQPAQKKGAVNSSKSEPDAIASSELFTEASKLRDAIERVREGDRGFRSHDCDGRSTRNRPRSIQRPGRSTLDRLGPPASRRRPTPRSNMGRRQRISPPFSWESRG